MDTDRITGIKWLAFALLFGGVIARWLHVDETGIVMNLGFLSFGVITLVDCLKAGYHRQLNIDTVRIILALVIAVLAVENISTTNQSYALFGVAILFQYLIGQRQRFTAKT